MKKPLKGNQFPVNRTMKTKPRSKLERSRKLTRPKKPSKESCLNPQINWAIATKVSLPNRAVLTPKLRPSRRCLKATNAPTAIECLPPRIWPSYMFSATTPTLKPNLRKSQLQRGLVLMKMKMKVQALLKKPGSLVDAHQVKSGPKWKMYSTASS